MLERSPDDPPALGQNHRIIDQPVLDMQRTEQQRWPAIGSRIRQPLGGLDRTPNELGLEHQILERIAGQLQLGHHDEVRAHRLGPPFENRRGVTGEVADALGGFAG